MSKILVLKQNKILSFLCIVIVFAAFFIRMIHLDSDLPPWGISFYTAVDEGTYSTLALNMQNYGALNPDKTVSEYPSYVAPHARMNFIGNFASYIGMRLLGDNYYGFRAPYVILGFINLLLFFLTLREIRKAYGDNKSWWTVILGSTYLIGDYTLHLASRIVEPSIVRMLLIQAAFLWFLCFREKTRLRFFGLGALITISVLFVYVTNVYLYFSSALIILFILPTQGKQAFWKALRWFAFGCLLIYILCEIYFILFWKTSVLVNLLQSVNEFSNVPGYVSGFSLRSIIKRIVKFFSSNTLLMNIPILALFLMGLPFSFFISTRKKDLNLLFLLCSVFSFLLQTMFSEDYIIRKFILIYPFFFFVIFILYYQFAEVERLYIAMKNKMSAFWWKVLNVSLLSLITLICITVPLFRLNIIEDSSRLDWTYLDKAMVYTFGILPIVILLVILILAIVTHISTKTFHNAGITIVLSLSFILNVLFSIKNIYASPTYTERDNMIKLGQLVGNAYVLGEYEMGMTLYNDIRPVTNRYEILKKYMEANHELYYFDYYDNYTGMRAFFDDVLFEDSEYTVMCDYRFSREIQTFGQKRSLALYTIAPKYEVVKKYNQEYSEWQFENINKKNKNQSIPQLEDISYVRAYPKIYDDLSGDILIPIYVDIHANIHGHIRAKIYGDVYGDIYGNIYVPIIGKHYGAVYGVDYTKKNEEIIISEKN